MTIWTSALSEMPDLHYIEEFEPDSSRYDQWLDKVMDEPWIHALEGMVRWSGLWVGTEEGFFAELRMRVGKDIFSSPDFPSDLVRLNEYIEIAFDGFKARGLNFWHLKDVPKEDLHHYDAPGWGPDAPILLYAGDAAERPHYFKTMCRLLVHAQELPLAVLIFTAKDRQFQRFGMWTGTTKDLLDKLWVCSPNVSDHFPIRLANCFRPEEEHRQPFRLRSNTPDLADLWDRGDYFAFHERMRRCAPVLRELKIKVSWQKRPYFHRPAGGGEAERRSRTYWTIESPRWKGREDLSVCSTIPARELPIVVASWIAAAKQT